MTLELAVSGLDAMQKLDWLRKEEPTSTRRLLRQSTYPNSGPRSAEFVRWGKDKVRCRAACRMVGTIQQPPCKWMPF